MAYITLRVLHGADRGRVFDRLPTPVTIGREEGNSIQLNDERISRYHLKLQEDNDRIVATDLESTNGTKVNGEDIQVRIIRDGDMIAVGRSLLLVGSQDRPEYVGSGEYLVRKMPDARLVVIEAGTENAVEPVIAMGDPVEHAGDARRLSRRRNH